MPATQLDKIIPVVYRRFVRGSTQIHQRKRMKLAVFLLVIACVTKSFAADFARPVVTDAVADAFVPADISAAKFEGYLGERITNNTEKRLLKINIDDILNPYVHRPGQHAW